MVEEKTMKTKLFLRVGKNCLDLQRSLFNSVRSEMSDSSAK